MRRTAAVILCCAAMVPGVASAQSMTVQTFLGKVAHLKSLGPLALMSGDMTALKTEMSATTKQYQLDKAAAAKAGRPFACPPEGAKMSQNDFLTAFNAIPPARRGMTVRQAFREVVATRWPCPKG